MAKPLNPIVSGCGIDQALANLRKNYGVTRIDMNNFEACERWPLSSPSLSHVLGGGLPKGRVLEIYGPESAGKSLVCTLIAGDVQRQGGVVAYIDMEYSFSPDFAKGLGLNAKDNDTFLYFQPDSGETAFNIIKELASSNSVSLIVIDSVSALTPNAVLNGEAGDSHVGLLARLMSQGLSSLVGMCSKTKTTLMFINQIREKIGVMFGSPETTSGGKALRFYASIRLDVRKVEMVVTGTKDNAVTIGLVSKVTAKKNKTAPPFRQCEVKTIFATGVDHEEEYINFGITQGIIEKSGSWYSYSGERLGLGKAGAAEALRALPHLFEKIKASVDAALLSDTNSGDPKVLLEGTIENDEN